MKKFWILAVAALAACDNETLVETQEVAPEKDVAIAFSTDYNKLTRAENSSATGKKGLEAYHKTFRVWGYKNVESETGTLSSIAAFDGTDDASIVTWNTSASDPFSAAEGDNGETGDWVYSPIRFWDKTAANYDFHAAAPDNAGWEATKTANSGMTVGALTFKKTGATVSGESLPFDYTSTTDKKVTGQPNDAFATDVDLMIAEDVTVEPENFLTASKVNFNFSHILSRFNIGVKTTLTSPNVVVLKSLEVYNMKSKGDFDEATDLGTDVLNKGTIKRWSNLSTPLTVGYPNDEVGIDDMELTDDVTDGTKTATPADYKLVYQGLVIPQTVKYQGDLKQNGSNATDASEVYLKIVYTLNEEEFTSFYNLASIFSTVNANVEGEYGTTCYTTLPDIFVYANAGNYYYSDGTQVPNYAYYKDGKYYSSDLSSGLVEIFLQGDGTFKDAAGETYAAAICIQLNEDNTVRTQKRSEVDGECDIDFCEGWQNNLWITISPEAILFDASVYEWATKENYEQTIQ